MSPTPAGFRELNLENGRPSAEGALRLLKDMIATYRRTDVKYIRIVHGYGSTGTGGAIRTAARAYLGGLHRQGRLRGFIPGDRFGSADPDAVALAVAHPGLRSLPDWNAGNPGVSIVVI